jgi:hypothetical protein
MRSLRAATINLLTAAVLFGSAVGQTPLSPDVLFKQAQQREQVDGDLEGAMLLYRRKDPENRSAS